MCHVVAARRAAPRFYVIPHTTGEIKTLDVGPARGRFISTRLDDMLTVVRAYRALRKQ